MLSRRTLLEWSVIVIPLIVIGLFGYSFVFGSSPAPQPSGLPDTTGGFYQIPFSPAKTYTRSMGDWKFTLTSSYTYTLAGRIVGRHEYPANPPEGIISLDLAVVNGNLVSRDILSFFSFEMGDRNLKYSYDIPSIFGLTEEYIDEHISNNHLVFLNTSLEQEVKQIPAGECIVIRGKLVDIRGTSRQEKIFFNTSTVRNDEYPTGCEIILVEAYEVVSCGG